MDIEILEILKSIQSDIKEIKEQLQENCSILKDLEHKEEVELNKEEHDKMINDEALINDLSTVELVTANNYAYIAELNAVK